MKGGRDKQKLGYSDVNLAEFAGGGCASQSYLLEGYNAQQRLCNRCITRSGR
jgi:hypothetical protein